MNANLYGAIIGAAVLKDYGQMANFGAWCANKRNNKHYLRANHLGKFRKGRK